MLKFSADADLPPPATADGEPAGWRATWGRVTSVHFAQVFETHYRFAGHAVRLRVIGTELARATERVFRHLASAPTPQPELRIDLWDESATSVSRPDEPPITGPDRQVRIGSSEVTIREQGRVLTVHRPPGSTTRLDRAGSTVIGWRRDCAGMSFAEYSKPLSLPLRVWYYDRDIDIVHAALVARKGLGVLVGGHSGAGKSTTALACLAAGFDCLGDDEIGLQRVAERTFVGHSLHNSIRIRRGSDDMVADWAPPPPRRDPETGKSLYFLSEMVPDSVPPLAAIRAAVFPRIVGSENCRTRSISPRDALLRLGGPSLFGPLGFGERAYLRLKRLFAEAPAFELELGRDWSTAPACLDEILARHVS